MNLWQTRMRAALVAALGAGVLALVAAPRLAYAEKAPQAASKGAAKKKAAKGTDADEAKRAEARARYEDGEAKLAAGDYAGAYAAYKNANEIIPSPQALYKIALALDKAGKTEDALAAYEAFLASGPLPDSFAARTAEAQGRVADLKKTLPLAVKITWTPATAALSVDGQAQVGTSPLELKLPPGKHAFHFASPGYDSADKELDVAVGSDALDVALNKSAPALASTPAPAPTPVAPPPPPDVGAPQIEKHSNATGYVLLGLAGAGVAVGSIFGAKALGEKKDFDNGLKTSDQADNVERDALIADLAFGTALTFGVTGVVLLFSKGDEPRAAANGAPASPSRSALRVVPVVGAHHASAVAKFEF